MLARLNPNGHVPVIDDEGLLVWESMAIRPPDLAEAYGGSLWPASTLGERAIVYQWSSESKPRWTDPIGTPSDGRVIQLLIRAALVIKSKTKTAYTFSTARVASRPSFSSVTAFSFADLAIALSPSPSTAAPAERGWEDRLAVPPARAAA